MGESRHLALSPSAPRDTKRGVRNADRECYAALSRWRSHFEKLLPRKDEKHQAGQQSVLSDKIVLIAWISIRPTLTLDSQQDKEFWACRGGHGDTNQGKTNLRDRLSN